MNRLNRRAYRSGGWHEMSAPHASVPKHRFSATFAAPYCVRMSMIPRYASPKGVSSARSWNCRRVSSAAGSANGPVSNSASPGTSGSRMAVSQSRFSPLLASVVAIWETPRRAGVDGAERSPSEKLAEKVAEGSV